MNSAEKKRYPLRTEAPESSHEFTKIQSKFGPAKNGPNSSLLYIVIVSQLQSIAKYLLTYVDLVLANDYSTSDILFP